ncbi:hypothetical protein ACQKN7_10740 [Bacillus cereus]|uniref:hypothetical protein n=1 Tax=Bacillus cereus TaxID=1396 RepID=UPI0037722AE1
MKIFNEIVIVISAILATAQFLHGHYYWFAFDLVTILLCSFWRLDESLAQIKKGS